MSTLKTTILLSALACLAMFSTAFAQDNVPVKAPESLKNVPFKIEGVEGFLHSLGIDPKTEIKLSKKELRQDGPTFHERACPSRRGLPLLPRSIRS